MAQKIFDRLKQNYQNYSNFQGTSYETTPGRGYSQLSNSIPTVYNPRNPSQTHHYDEPTPLLSMTPKIGESDAYYSPSPIHYDAKLSPTHNISYYSNNDPKYNPNCKLQSSQSDFRRHSGFRRLSKLQRSLSIVLTISKCLSATLSALMEAIMVFMMYKFQQTRHIAHGQRSTPWAIHTKLWPTVMLAIASGFTLASTLWSLIAMCRKKAGKEGKIKKSQRLVTIAKYALHIAAWAGVTLAYRLGKTGDDLWGWSCSEKAQAIQEAFKTDLNFERLCIMQSTSWIFSLSEFGAKCVFGVVAFAFHRLTQNARVGLVTSFSDIALDQM